MLRALGPSLSGFGLSGVLSDPVLSVYNSSGTLIATNDNWQSDPNHFVVEANGLAPANPLESATAQTLAPGAYTVIVTGKDATPGIGLVELYDLSPLSNSKLKNMSTRGSVGTGDNVLISGFIVGDVGQRDRGRARPWSIAGCLRCERSAKRSHTDNLRFEWLCHRQQRQLARRC